MGEGETVRGDVHVPALAHDILQMRQLGREKCVQICIFLGTRRFLILSVSQGWRSCLPASPTSLAPTSLGFWLTGWAGERDIEDFGSAQPKFCSRLRRPALCSRCRWLCSMIGMAVVGISLLCVSSTGESQVSAGESTGISTGTANAQGLHLWMGFADLGKVSRC